MLTTPCPPDLDALLEAVTMQVKKKARGAMAPLACIQAVRAAATMPYSKGIKRESELMATLFNSGQARALQYCFFAQRTAGKWTLPSGAQWNNSKPREIRSAAVIGIKRPSLYVHEQDLGMVPGLLLLTKTSKNLALATDCNKLKY